MRRPRDVVVFAVALGAAGCQRVYIDLGYNDEQSAGSASGVGGAGGAIGSAGSGGMTASTGTVGAGGVMTSTGSTGSGGMTASTSGATSTGTTGGGGSTTGTGTGGAAGQGGMGGTGGAKVCVPGSVMACYDGPAGTEAVGVCVGGQESCTVDGTGYGLCLGEVVPAAQEDCATPADDDCNGLVNDASEGCVCAVGTTAPCYDGPMGTAGVGICKAGTKACAADGRSYGACAGEVVPLPPSCANTIDDNCTGQPMPGCACVPGASMTCYDGPAGTAGVGVCKGGTASCDAQGTGYGSCAGDVLPQSFDDCNTPQDENCDGVAPACTGNHTWSHLYGDAASQYGLGIATDAADNAWVAGQFAGSMSFSAGIFVKKLTSAGSGDGFLLKLSPSGGVLSWMQLGGATSDELNQVVVDSTNSAVAVGSFSGSMVFGGKTYTSAGLGDAFILKLDPSANIVWVKALGDTGNQYRSSIAVDAAGNVFLASRLHTMIDVGGGPVVNADSGDDLLLAKFDPAGKHLWDKQIQLTKSPTSFPFVAADGGGDVMVTCSFAGSVSIDKQTANSSGVTDTLLAKLDPSGALLWMKTFTGSGPHDPTGLSVDGSGNILLTGTFEGTMSFGGAMMQSASLTNDIFVAKLDPGGTQLWSTHFGSTKSSGSASIAVDGAGNPVIAGGFTDAINFGLGSLASAGGSDVFVTKLAASSGATLWAKRSGDASNQAGFAVAVDGAGSELLTGYAVGSVDFGGNTLTSAGQDDVFVAKFAP